MLRIVELEKLSHDQAAITAGYRASMTLQEAGWMRYTAACWDRPALVAFDGPLCVAGLNFSEDQDDLAIDVRFAWCDAAHPRALALLLMRFRTKVREGRSREVRFTCHRGNVAMEKAVRVLGVQPWATTYRMTIGGTQEGER